MSTGGYKIACEPGTGTIRISLSGFWSSEVADAFTAELYRAIDRNPRPNEMRRRLTFLVNFTDCVVQSPAMVERFQRFTNEFGAGARRVAIVVDSALLRMQTRRLAPFDHYRFFASEEEAAAEAWLRSDSSES